MPRTRGTVKAGLTPSSRLRPARRHQQDADCDLQAVLPRPAAPPLQRAEHPLDVFGLPHPLMSEIPGRRREWLAGALGGLRVGVKVLHRAWRLALERCLDVRELGAELGLDLLGAVELAAGAVHAADL